MESNPTPSQTLNGLAALDALRRAHDRHQRPTDDDFAKKYPHLFSILSDVRISDSEEIAPPSLILKNAGGSWSLAVIVSGLAMAGDIQAVTFTDALRETEKRLGNGTYPWRTMGNKAPARKKIVSSQKGG